MNQSEVVGIAAMASGLYAGSLVYAQLSAAPLLLPPGTSAGAAQVRFRLAVMWLLASSAVGIVAAGCAWWIGAGLAWLLCAVANAVSLLAVVYLAARSQHVRGNWQGDRVDNNDVLRSRWTLWHGAATTLAVVVFVGEIVLLTIDAGQ